MSTTRRCIGGFGAGDRHLAAGQHSHVAGAAERREAHVGTHLLGRVAQALVGAALVVHCEPEAAAGLLDRDNDAHLIAVRFDLLLKGLVELDLAGGDQRLAERRAGGGELELLAVQVVAGRHVEAQLDAATVEHARRGLESHLRVEKVVGG